MTTPLLVTPAKESSYLGVRFRPGGAQPIFGLPMHELTDLRVELEAMEPNSLAPDWWERLRGAGPLENQVRLFDELLAEKLLAAVTRDPRMGAAVQQIERFKGRISVESLSQGLGLSRQHLTRLFGHHVGIGVKLFSRIIRMQSVLVVAMERVFGDDPDADWATLALEFGYCDQSHLSVDFKAFTGLSPGRFQRVSQSRSCNQEVAAD